MDRSGRWFEPFRCSPAAKRVTINIRTFTAAIFDYTVCHRSAADEYGAPMLVGRWATRPVRPGRRNGWLGGDAASQNAVRTPEARVPVKKGEAAKANPAPLRRAAGGVFGLENLHIPACIHRTELPAAVPRERRAPTAPCPELRLMLCPIPCKRFVGRRAHAGGDNRQFLE